MRITKEEGEMLEQTTWAYTTRVSLIILATSIFISCEARAAADQATLNQMTETVNSLCLSGSRFHLDANVSGGISFLKRGGEVAAKVDVFQQPGAAAYLSEEIRRLADDDIRRCTEPYLKRIFDYIERGGKPSTRREEGAEKASTHTNIQQSTTGTKSHTIVTDSGDVNINN
jgi:hypothetical protein